MARPEQIPVNSSQTGWVANLNDSFEQMLDAPFPMAAYANSTVLAADANALLYESTFAVVGHEMYKQTGVGWDFYREQLDYMADLNPGTATLSDIVDAYNDLIDDMQDKGWMN